LGRVAELAEINRLLASVREGLGGALLLRGEAGIGKTALLERAAEAASGMRILRTVGIQSEMELGYAGLHQLLHPFASDLEKLPAPQREALRVAFGTETGEINRMLVGLATLTLLSSIGSHQPVLCLIDDAQWLDRESASAMAFVARRLDADAVGVLITLRDPGGDREPYSGVRELVLGGLARDDVAVMLARLAGPLQPDLVDRVTAETGGNPLALLELSAGLDATELGHQVSIPQPLPLGRRLEERFRAQVRSLPPDTQALLLAAAADTSGDPALVFSTGSELGFDSAAAAPAEAVGILVVGSRVAFRHPLIRSAVYYGATLQQRRRTHDALASATDAERDPDRRAWHRAVAAEGPDENLAQELQRAAVRAKNRGGCAAAASFLSRAAQLTPDPDRRATRRLAAAEEELAAGAPAHAQPLLDQATPELTSPADQARAKALQGELLNSTRTATDAVPRAAATLLEAARTMRAYDVQAARGLLLRAMEASVNAGQFAEGASVADVAHAALDMPLSSGDTPSADDLLLDGNAALYSGDFAGAVPRLRAAIASLRADPGVWSLRNLNFGCWSALALGDIDALGALSRAFEAFARAQGAWYGVTRALHFVVLAEIATGSLAAATEHAEVSRQIEAARGDSSDDSSLALCLAWRGREDELRTQAARAAINAPAAGLGWQMTVHQSALALLELGRGDHAAAWASMPRARDLYPATFAIPDFVEAAARTDHVEAATKVAKRYEQQSMTAGTPAMLGLLARCQALLAADDADVHFRESIDLLESTGAVGQAARSRLLYGQWLQRGQRLNDAGSQLRGALRWFDAIGADGFAATARAALVDVGERVRQPEAGPSLEFTTQEAQVARMAADGATNQEIASRMFISPNTVDYHLRKVYRKVGVTNRARLASELRGRVV
jgi:DNA-binding CsgD family transcriptional regulator